MYLLKNVFFIQRLVADVALLNVLQSLICKIPLILKKIWLWESHET